MLLSIITEFNKQFCDFIDGSTDRIEVNELTGGARVLFIFNETFGKTLDSIDYFNGLSNQDVLTAIKNAKGLGSSHGTTAAFELLVKRQIQKLEEPSLR
jgi:hypothetical protein